jgi:hypothetical protein
MRPGVLAISPDGIADPEDRQKYDQAVAAQAEKVDRYRTEAELRQLDAELTQRARVYIASAFLRSPKSANEMNEAITTHIHNAVRAVYLRFLVQPYS